MVLEALTPKAWGGLGYCLRWMEGTLIDARRPWVVCDVDPHTILYAPALSLPLRLAMSEARLFFLRAPQVLAPFLVQDLLQSGLCEGVLLRGLDQFPASSPAGLWSRRWQLAARRGDSSLMWVHEKDFAVIGFDVRLRWHAPQSFDIRKGHGFFDEQKQIIKSKRPQSTAA